MSSRSRRRSKRTDEAGATAALHLAGTPTAPVLPPTPLPPCLSDSGLFLSFSQAHPSPSPSPSPLGFTQFTPLRTRHGLTCVSRAPKFPSDEAIHGVRGDNSAEMEGNHRDNVRFRTSAFGSLSSVAVAENKEGDDMAHGFGEESETKRGAAAVSEVVARPVWIEVADKVRREYGFGGATQPAKFLQVNVLKDTRPPVQKAVDSFLSRFFPLGYPNSVAEGYLVYSQYRAVQHFASAVLHVLSTQSLLFAAGLRPTPAQATIVSWVLKDGMQHVGKMMCSRMGARMDSEPKRWRIFADFMYDVGAGLEVISPLCPQHFLPVAGMANLAKGMALVSARATRLPVYSSFAKEGNLSDLYAKGEAISTLSNVLGLGVGIHLASNLGASIQGKLIWAPILSAVHLYCVQQEMRAAPINTLNSQRTAMLVADFVKTGSVSSPAELRYRERLILPVGLEKDAGNVRVGASLVGVGKPSTIFELKRRFQGEQFLLHFGEQATDMILHQKATGEDAVRGWLLATHVSRLCKGRTFQDADVYGKVLEKAYDETERCLPNLLSGLKDHGWHSHLFLEGSGVRAVW